MSKLSKENLRLWSYLVIAIFVVLGLAVLTNAETKNEGAASQYLKTTEKTATTDIPDVNAAELVRAVRQSENWIHRVNSLYIRIEGKWTRTPEAIAAYCAELKQQFPDADLDPKFHRGLQPSSLDILEIAIDKQRLRKMHHRLRNRYYLKIWDGKQLLVHSKYFATKQEIYIIEIKPERIDEVLFGSISWLRAQPHSFWWNPIDVEENLRYWGRPEAYVIAGRSKYRGVDCYVLEWKPLPRTGTRRWYVGTKDHLLYGNVVLNNNKLDSEYWTLDYREVAPGCWLPMMQGYELYDQDRRGESYLQVRHDVNVLEARINEKLPDELFQMEFKEGVKVVDARFGGVVTYPYKANRTDEEWREIIEKARKQPGRKAKEKQSKNALIGKPAPPFPQNASWLNSEPLTWKELAGKVVILDFWADWCGPCRNDLPLMSALHKKRQETGIIVIGIHTPGSKIENIRKVMKKYELNYPICIDAPAPRAAEGFGAMSSMYGVTGIPYAFVIDREGNVTGHGWGVSGVLGHAQELVKK